LIASEDMLDGARWAINEFWRKTLAGSSTRQVAVLLVVAGFDSYCERSIAPEPSDDICAKLVDALFGGRIRRNGSAVQRADTILLQVTRLRGHSAPRPMTSNHFGVVVWRLRQALIALAKESSHSVCSTGTSTGRVHRSAFRGPYSPIRRRSGDSRTQS